MEMYKNVVYEVEEIRSYGIDRYLAIAWKRVSFKWIEVD